MIPVLTPEEMAGVDARAPGPVDVLVARAGAAVANAAIEMLGGAYGRRVVVVAGPGNNGNDGRVAARRLAARGAKVVTVEAGDAPGGVFLGDADLVIDAAYGTGLRRPYDPPDPGRAPVLAVDIPSGVSGITGLAVGERSVVADRTVTFAALKPGLLVGEGPDRAGALGLAGIGLSGLAREVARAWLVEDADVDAGIPPLSRDGHKWQRALAVVAGSPGMTGAPWLVSRAAMRSGAGYVRLGMPGVDLSASPLPPGEVVGLPLSGQGWAAEVLVAGLGRFGALVVGPGLGAARLAGARSEVASLVQAAPMPVVIDADGLGALGSLDVLRSLTDARHHPTVITPHVGEWTHLVGEAPGADRISSVREVARRSGAVVLLKGATTVVADPTGRVLLSTAGPRSLATAGSGDVLSGIIGALLSAGVPAPEAAALGAHVHGRAASAGYARGLVAGDLPDLVAEWLSGRPPMTMLSR
jgi:NAD(P)H-hydrate epimerase